jgi:hypothetical protein
MTEWGEMEPLFRRWVYTSLAAIVVMTICMALYPLIPEDPMWSIHRYIVSRLAAFALGSLALPGIAILADYISPGGSFIEKAAGTAIGAAAIVAALFLGTSLLLCFV